MKKVTIILFVVLLVNGTFALSAPGTTNNKKIPSQLIQVNQGKTIDFAGARIFVPKGQTIILGQRDNGAIVLRGRNLKNIRLEDASLSTQGNTVLSFYPSSRIAFLHRGETMTITDAHGNISTVSNEGAISTQNATINSDTVTKLKEQAKKETAQVTQELGDGMELPDFVVATQTSSITSEQAVQNVKETEETLSPSAPR